MIPLIQYLRQTIKTIYGINLQFIDEMGGDEGIAEIDAMRGYIS